jgi:hypothetical protein
MWLCAFYPVFFYGQVNIVKFDTLFETMVNIEISVKYHYYYKTVTMAKDVFLFQRTLYHGEISAMWKRFLCFEVPFFV